jgi:hypothetical protein
MTMKSNRLPGSGKGPLRDWSMGSYDQEGRSASSLADEHGRGSPSTTHAGRCDPQIPTAFDRIDGRRTQSRTPVKHRPVTDKHEG